MGLTHKNTYTLAGPVGVWLTGSRTAWKNGSLSALGENWVLQADLYSGEFAPAGLFSALPDIPSS